MSMMPVPSEAGSLIAQLVVGDGEAAVRFYHRAFGARELYRQRDAAGLRLVHCELLIGLSRFIVHDEFTEHGLLSPPSLGGTPVTLMHYVNDVDSVFTTAVAHGATVVDLPEDKFWGLRSAVVIDPFGHRWLLATRIEDLSPHEIIDRAQIAPPSERAPMGKRSAR